MTRPDLFDRVSGPVLAALAAGASVDDAARHAGCSGRTVQRWLASGREDSDGRFGAFAAAVDRKRESRQMPATPMDADELARTVSEAARNGNVSAMRFRWETLLAEAHS